MDQEKRALASMVSRLEQSGVNLDEYLQAPKGPNLLQRILDLLSRPNYASAGAAKALVEGRGPIEAVKAAGRGLFGDDKTTYSQVLESAGVGDAGKARVPILGDITGRGTLGLALDIALDPTTYLTFGTGAATKIGSAGARKALTRAGEEALQKGATVWSERLARRAAGRVAPEALEQAGRRVAETKLLEKVGTESGKNLFERGGISLKFPGADKITLADADQIRALAKQVVQTADSTVNVARRLPGGKLLGGAYDFTKAAPDFVREVARSTFVPGAKFTKKIKEFTATQREAAKQLGLSAEEAAKVFPEVASDVQGALNRISKDKQFAATQAYKNMVDTFAQINPEEGKVLAEALEEVPGAVEKLSPNGQKAHTAIREMLKVVGQEQLDYGFINKMVDNFSPRFLTEEARTFIKENLNSGNSAYRGLIKIFSPVKNKERVLIDASTRKQLIEKATKGTAVEVTKREQQKIVRDVSKRIKKIVKDPLKQQARIDVEVEKRIQKFAERKALAAGKTAEEAIAEIDKKFSSTFLGREVKENTIKEINEISEKELGFRWFEDDLTKALPRYYVNFSTNKALMDGLQALPQTINRESGYQVFRPLVAEGQLARGYRALTLPGLEGWQAPRFIADQIEDTYKIMSNDESLNKFLQTYDRALSKFKAGVTLFFPTFHTQNYIGGQFANFQYGLTPGTPKWFQRQQQAMKVMQSSNELITEGALKGKTYADVMRLYEQSGGAGGFFHGEVGESVYRKVFADQQGGFSKVIRKGGEAADALGSRVENLNRLPIFIEELAKHGDPQRAVKQVFKYHFDYSLEAYSTVEREVFQRLIPFYRFMRGNVPLQLETLFNQTGKQTALLKTMRELGGGQDDDKPDWLQRKFSIKVDDPTIAKLLGAEKGEKLYLTLPFAFADLGNLEPKMLLNASSPLIKVPAELIFNKELFFGNHIWNEDLPPEAQTSRAYPVLKPIVELPIVGDGIKKFLNWKERPLKDPVTGEMSGGVYYEADSKAIYLLKSMLGPLSRAYIQYGQGVEGGISGGLFDVVSPFNAAKVNEQEQKVYDLRERSAQMRELISYLNKRGVLPEAQKRKAGSTATLTSDQGLAYYNEVAR